MERIDVEKKAIDGDIDYDVRLVSSIVGGGGEAAEELYKRYSTRVFRFVFRHVGERVEDAEEVTLDTFLSAIELAPSFRATSSVIVWLCGIAKLRIADFHRRKSRAKRRGSKDDLSLNDLLEDDSHLYLGLSTGYEEFIERLVKADVVATALQQVSIAEREALLLKYVDELSTREIATIMSKSERAVESLILRARTKPRRYLEQLLHEDSPV